MIDELMLIDELTEKIDEVLDDLEKDESYMPLHGYWYGLTLARRIVLKQPKLSLENKTSDKWIPFDKQLPPKLEDGIYKGYIVQVINVLEPFSAYWDGENWLDEWYDKMCGVIAWMPLPEPYKGEEK